MNILMCQTLLYESPKDSLGKCFVLFFIGTHETLGNYLEKVIAVVSAGKN